MKMKILIICSVYKPNVGGVEKSIEELSTYYRQHGHEVVVLTKRFPFSLDDYEIIDSLQVYRIDRPKQNDDYFKFKKWLDVNEKNIKADIVHVIGIRRPMSLIALILSKLWKVPLITTFCGGDIGEENDKIAKQVWEEGRDTNINSIYQSDYFSAYSKGIIEEALKKLPKLKNKIDCIYSSIDFQELKIFPIKSTIPYIITVRRLTHSKGIDILIRAFNIIKNDFPDLRLKIVGDGEEKENLITLSKQLGIYHKIDFLGFLSIKDVYNLISQALIHICPSRSEGGGTINIEASACGCAVIGSNVEGIPEYIKNNETGLLFKNEDYQDLADKIKIILNDEKLRKNFIQNGIDFSKQFDINIIGKKYIEIYEKIVKDYKYRPFKEWSDLTKTIKEIFKL